MKKGLLILLASLMFGVSHAQQQEIKIANEYFEQGEFEKAKDVYQKLLKQPEAYTKIYANYLDILKRDKQYDEAQKFIKKTINTSKQDNLKYRIDYGLLYAFTGSEKEKNKYFDKLIAEIKGHQLDVETAGEYLIENRELELAEKVYQEGRKSRSGNYNYELANIYRLQDKKDMMISEMLTSMESRMVGQEQIQNMLQNMIQEPDEFEMLDHILLMKVQQKPDMVAYNELLVWSNIQQKNFYGAFIQSRAMDKKNRTEGNKTLEVGMIAYNNKDYEQSKDIFEWIVKEYPKGQNYMVSKHFMIKSKEELIKNTYPVDKSHIQSLIEDYKSLINENTNDPQAQASKRNMALLNAFYLDEGEKAIEILQEVIKNPRTDPRFMAQCKLDLGDIYLFREEPWEATLLYSQVEKQEKDQPLGHEAKLKNAKLNYYKGDFELAQEHLDVLKLATSREIANDALDLSVLIQENTGLDSNSVPMQRFAKAEMLIYQNKNEEALALLSSIETEYAGHPLIDDVLLTKASLREKEGNWEKALESLESIIKNHRWEINSDKAHYKAARIYEEKLNNKDKAMELYQNLMVNHPGSIFIVDARKRFRSLRGDKIN